MSYDWYVGQEVAVYYGRKKFFRGEVASVSNECVTLLTGSRWKLDGNPMASPSEALERIEPWSNNHMRRSRIRALKCYVSLLRDDYDSEVFEQKLGEIQKILTALHEAVRETPK